MGTLVFNTPEESIKNLFHLPESKRVYKVHIRLQNSISLFSDIFPVCLTLTSQRNPARSFPGHSRLFLGKLISYVLTSR